MIPQTQAAISKADIPVAPRATPKRGPMAFYIWGAVATSAAMWVGIIWFISLVLSAFA